MCIYTPLFRSLVQLIVSQFLSSINSSFNPLSTVSGYMYTLRLATTFVTTIFVPARKCYFIVLFSVDGIKNIINPSTTVGTLVSFHKLAYFFLYCVKKSSFWLVGGYMRSE